MNFAVHRHGSSPMVDAHHLGLGSKTCLAWCFLIRVTLVVEVALLNLEIIKHQNQHKYNVLGECGLRCLPRGCVVADNLVLRVSEYILQKYCIYAGLRVLFFSNQPQAAPESYKGTW